MTRQDTELAGEASRYHPCTPDGHRHWGPEGAAGALVFTEHGGRLYVLLAKRSKWVQAGGTWSVPGGAIDTGESARDAAMRELAEEIHGIAAGDTLIDSSAAHVAPCPQGCGWQYTTVILRVPLHASGRLPRVAVRRGRDAWETSAVAWVPAERVASMRLHPGLASAWPALREQIERERVAAK